MVSRRLVKKFLQKKKNRAARQQLYRSSLSFQRRRFFKNLVQKSIVGSLTTDGKKLRATQVFYATIRYLRFVFGIQRPLEFVFNIIVKLRPLFGVRLFRKGGSVYKVPAPITFKRSLLQVFGWFRRAVKARKERFYHERFLGELSSIIRFTGETYKQYKVYHSSALQNRALIRRALTPYRSLKLRRRRRRRNYQFKFLRRRRIIDLFGVRLKNRYVRRRYHGLFISFRQFWYYLFFYHRSRVSSFTENLQFKQLFSYMFYIHRKLIRYVYYREGFPTVRSNFKVYMQKFFFSKIFRFALSSRFFGDTDYPQSQVYRSNKLSFYFIKRKRFFSPEEIRTDSDFSTKYNSLSTNLPSFRFSDLNSLNSNYFKTLKLSLPKYSPSPISTYRGKKFSFKTRKFFPPRLTSKTVSADNTLVSRNSKIAQKNYHFKY